jgi:hypothetical protein
VRLGWVERKIEFYMIEVHSLTISRISGEIRSVRIQGQEGNDIHIHNNFKKTEELVVFIESLLAEAIHR